MECLKNNVFFQRIKNFPWIINLSSENFSLHFRNKIHNFNWNFYKNFPKIFSIGKSKFTVTLLSCKRSVKVWSTEIVSWVYFSPFLWRTSHVTVLRISFLRDDSPQKFFILYLGSIRNMYNHHLRSKELILFKDLKLTDSLHLDP